MERKRRNVKTTLCRGQSLQEGDNSVYHLYLSMGEMMTGKRETHEEWTRKTKKQKSPEV